MQQNLSNEQFFPKGAIAFFATLLVLCAVLWFVIYFIMLQKI
jgi:hypothetical protein